MEETALTTTWRVKTVIKNSIPLLEGEARHEDPACKAVGDSSLIAAAPRDAGNMATFLSISLLIVQMHRCTHNPPVNPGMQL